MEGRIIEGPCGAVLRGGTTDEVVAAAQAHARTVHDMDLTRDQAEAMVRPA